MKLGIMQPYLFPYIGYFQLIKVVDKYIVSDDLHYIKHGWINRNYILVNNEKKMFTIKLKKASSNKLINEIEILDDFKDWLKTIQLNYSKAPYYKEIYDLLKRIINYDNRVLSEFIINSLREILQYLQIKTPILKESQLNKNHNLKGQDEVIELCHIMGANCYINAIGGQELYNKTNFNAHGIELNFIKTELVPYKQFRNEFIPSLSILDIMMFNSVDEINCMLDQYYLI